MTLVGLSLRVTVPFGVDQPLQVRESAEQALGWARSFAANIPQDDLVLRISRIGAQGRHDQNCERDLQQILRSFGSTTQVPISQVRARFYDFRTDEVVWRRTSVIMPDDLATALWHEGEDVFKRFLVGDVDLLQFWNHAARSVWFQHHPDFDTTASERARLLPFSLYGDDVQAFRNSEAGAVSVLAWSSEVTFQNSALSRYLLIGCYSEATSTDDTYSDILAEIVPRIQKMVDRSSEYPWSSKGWRFAYSSTQGDMKWIVDHFGANNFRKNTFCSRCPCLKSSPNIGLTLGNFLPDAEHMQTRYSHEDFLESTPEDDRSCLFQISGARYDRFLHDCCHSQLLCTGKTSNGSCLIYLCERGCFGEWPSRGLYDDQLYPLLRKAYSSFRAWLKEHKLQCSQPRFTPSRLHRTSRQSFPSLSSKAHASKLLTFWLTAKANEFQKGPHATDLDRQVHICMFAYARALQLMDMYHLVFPATAADEFHRVVMLHLQTYADLHRQSSTMVRKQVNRCNWQLIPKHHHFIHVAEEAKLTQLNPRMHNLLSAESFVGYIGRISRACHRTSVDFRTAQRYLVCLFFEVRGGCNWT